MGQQIGFYTTFKDELELLAAIMEQEPVLVAPHVMTDVDADFGGVLPPLDYAFPRFVDVFLFRAPDQKNLRIKDFGPGNLRIDDEESPVLRWTRSQIHRGVATSGRLWYEPCRRSGKKKGKAFLAWASTVFGCARKLFAKRKDISPHYRLGSDFLRRYDAGGIEV